MNSQFPLGSGNATQLTLNSQLQPSPTQAQLLPKEKSQLWMGELDPWWDENAIRSIWASLGENVVGVKLIREKTGSTEANNAGYCFVDFGTYLAASKAIMKNGLIIPGTSKTLKLNWASGGGSSFNHHGGSNNNSISNGLGGNVGINGGNFGGPQVHESSIFVGDLANDIKEQELLDLFKSRYASVSGIKIMYDPLTGASRGYGFIRFTSEADQQRALIEMNGVMVNGRPIRVSTAVPKNSNNSSANNNIGFNNNANAQLFGANGSPSRAQPSVTTSQFQPPLNQYTDPNNTTVFVGGLSNGVTEQQLRSFFEGFGDIIYVKVLQNKGCGFVQYVLRSSAENAIQQMQGYPIGNSRIRLSWGRSSSQNNQNQQKYLQQLAAPNLFSQFNETNDQYRLNTLLNAARDGRLDRVETTSNGFIYA